MIFYTLRYYLKRTERTGKHEEKLLKERLDFIQKRIYSSCMGFVLRRIIFLSFLVIFIAFLNFGNIYGQETETKKYSLSLSTMFGMLVGEADEILYKYNTGNQYVSQLIWDMKPSVYVGISAEYGPSSPFSISGFTSEASLKFGLPMKIGKMEDKDWKYTDNDDLTHYSVHDAFSINMILGDVSMGYAWNLTDFFTLSLSGEISFMYLFWSAENGYFQHLNTYPDGTVAPGQTWSDSIPKQYLNGPVIQYNQIWLAFSPGVSMKAKFNSRFTVTGHLSYSPLIYGADKDDHLLPYVIYNPILMEYERYEGKRHSGQFFGGHYVNGGVNFNFTFGNLDITLSASYKYITELRGVTFFQNIYIMQSSSNPVYRNIYDGGMGYSALDLGLSAKFNF